MHQQQQRLVDAALVTRRLAHDFGNVLTSVLGYCELALNHLPDDVPGKQFVSEAFRNAQRGADMTASLRMMRHRPESTAVTCSLEPVLHSERARLQEIRGSAVHVHVDVEPDLSELRIGSKSLEQILQGILDNAHEAIEGQGEVTVSAREVTLAKEECAHLLGNAVPGLFVKIRVADSGRGLSAEARERLFVEPFFSDKPRHRGYGLSIVHGVVSSFGGALVVQPNADQGTVVDVLLPSARTAATRRATGNDSRAGESASLGRILVVDDEKTVVSLASLILTNGAYQVESTTKPEEALNRFRAEPDGFDLVLTDWIMPRLTGVDLTKSILKLRPEQCVLFMSGHVTADVVSAQFPRQANVKLLPKPFRSAELIRAVKQLLSGEGSPRTDEAKPAP